MKINLDTSSQRSTAPQAGYSLTEMMVVIVIVMVVTLMPVMMIRSTKEQFSRQTFVRELKSAFERARFDSVKRKPEAKENMARVKIWSDSFELVTYANRTGNVDAAGVQQVAQTQTKSLGNSNAAIFAHASSGVGSGAFPITLTFDSRGEVSAVDAGQNPVSNPAFVICQGNCSNYTAQNSNIILVSPTGTVNLLPGDAGIPTFISPASTGAVTASSSINRLVTIPIN